VPPFYALVTLYTICDSGCPVPIGGEGLTLAVGVLAGPVALLGAGLWTLATGRGRQVWGYWVFLAEVLGIVVIILLNP
ncbi:MAG: hypothetical protein QOE45_702, partial [Frankiaceae bacterium]|nr:hypothetical protein [Frankiaceae bacterium]